MDKLLLRASEVGQLIGVGRSKAYQLIASGDLPSVRLGKGRCVRVPADGLRRWIEELRRTGVKEASKTA
jgi:excisionase family DNA binding protein